MSFGFNFGEVVPRLKTGDTVDGITPLTQTPDSWVYRLQKGDDRCILRISTPTDQRDDWFTSAEGIARRIKALQQGKNLEVYEQLIDYSMEHEAVLTQEAPGKTLTNLVTSEAPMIRPEHLELVAQAVGQGALRHLVIDATPENMLFHPDHGFTIIDYGLKDEDYSPSAPEEYARFLSVIGGAIVTLEDPADFRAAWSRVLDDGLTVFRQVFNSEPGIVMPLLLEQQRFLSGQEKPPKHRRLPGLWLWE